MAAADRLARRHPGPQAAERERTIRGPAGRDPGSVRAGQLWRWEHQVGDTLALNVERRVAKSDVLDGQFTEERATLAHDHGHQVDGDRVEQPDL